MAETEKISITLGKSELRRAKRLAADLGLSLSTFINDSVKRRIEAQERKSMGELVIASFAPQDLPSRAEMRELLARWQESPTDELPPRQRRTSRARGPARPARGR
jgi:hypothetical protein